MSDPIGESRFEIRWPTWHCEVHGSTDAVMHIAIRKPKEDSRAYCVLCLRDLLEKNGLKPLEAEH